jgi:small subunit ribosomal protein S12
MSIINKLKKKKYKYNTKNSILNKCPMKKGICLKVFIAKPKKPNSANRKVVKVLLSNKKKVICYIPGIQHNLQRYSTVLIRGGRIRDLPGVKFKVIRGKFDLKRVYDRYTSRSKYGIPKLK